MLVGRRELKKSVIKRGKMVPDFRQAKTRPKTSRLALKLRMCLAWRKIFQILFACIKTIRLQLMTQTADRFKFRNIGPPRWATSSRTRLS